MTEILAIVGVLTALVCFSAMVYIAVLYDRARRGIIDRYRRGSVR